MSLSGWSTSAVPCSICSTLRQVKVLISLAAQPGSGPPRSTGDRPAGEFPAGLGLCIDRTASFDDADKPMPPTAVVRTTPTQPKAMI
jgi:hypothetical protein